MAVLNFIKKLINKFIFIKRNSVGDISRKIITIGGGTPKLSIGRHSYINELKLYCWRPGFSFSVGSYCSMAEGIVVLLGGEHDIDWVSTYPFIERWNIKDLNNIVTPKCRGDITIGNDVWIGHGVTILSGTVIGTGAIIGAGSVIRGDIPPYTIMVGAPAKAVRKRFTDELCEKLILTEWWKFEKDFLEPLVPFMNNPNKFLIAFEKSVFKFNSINNKLKLN